MGMMEQIAEAVVKPSEYLTFRLGNEEYGIDILKVQEIRGYDAVTRIAGAPEFLKGVINLRGVIVPIVDLRLKFNLGEVRYDEFTVVVILNVAGRIVGARRSKFQNFPLMWPPPPPPQSFYQGITGLVSQPMAGAEKDGVYGFFKVRGALLAVFNF